MNETRSLAVFIPLLLTVVLVFILYIRRKYWRIKLPSDSLVIPFFLIFWIAALCFGQITGSVSGMTWVACGSLLLLSIALLRTKPSTIRETETHRWSIFDWASFVFLIFVFFRFTGNDPYCHYSVTATILRGNIPPSALNDPSFPLVYHYAFNLPAAVFTRGIPLPIEAALDLVSVICIFGVIEALQWLSRTFFKSSWAQQSSRLLFLFGLGPTYLDAFRNPGLQKLHGGTIQAYGEVIFRRPMALNFLIFIFLLCVLLPFFTSAKNSGDDFARANSYPYLLFAAFLLPLTSEELTVYFTIAVAILCFTGRSSYRFGLLWIVALALAFPLSGVFRAHLVPNPPMPFPKLTVSWPLLLPRWPEAGAPNYSVPLFSRALLEVLTFEWGPVFFLGLLTPFLIRDKVKTRLVIIILISFIPAFLFTVRNWVQADLDRFLFYGSTMGFFLAAQPVETLQLKYGGSSKKYLVFPAIVIYALFAISAPIIFLFLRTDDRSVISPYDRFLNDGVKMRKTLAIVGPRDQISADYQTAQRLVLAGFLVAAPMSSNSIGVITPEKSGNYANSPRWLLVRRRNPQAAGKKKFGRFEDFVLIKAPKNNIEPDQN